MSLLSIFRLTIPEFAHLSDETVQSWLDLIDSEVSKTGFPPSVRARMIAYRAADEMSTAHRLKGSDREVASLSEGSLRISYDKGKSSNYREQYRRLVRAHTITPYTRICL